MNNIVKVSRAIRIVLVIAALFQISLWGYFSLLPQMTDSQTFENGVFHVLLSADFEGMESEAQQLRSAGIDPGLWLNTPPTVFFLFLYSLLFGLFGHYQQGDIFGTAVTGQIRKIGLSVILWPVIQILYPPVVIVSFKLAGVLEHGSINIALGSNTLTMMATGVMITVVGWVMAEGAQMKKEQELTV